jgi:hypothetical protein
MNRFRIALLLLCLLPGLAGALTISVSNYNPGGNGFHGVAGDDGELVGPGSGFGVIGYFEGLTNDQVANLVAQADLAALHAAFQVFGAAGGVFPLANVNLDGPPGAFDASITFPTRPSANSFGGKPVYFWLFKGVDRSASTEFLLARLPVVFPTESEDEDILVPLELDLNPEASPALLLGRSGPATHDYGFGSGPLAVYRMNILGQGGSNGPVALPLMIVTQWRVPYQGQLEGEGDDPLTFALSQPPAKGDAQVNADGSFTYTAAPDAVGMDSFTFLVQDDSGEVSVPATVTIVIGNGGLLGQVIDFPPPQDTLSNAPPLQLFASSTSGLPVTFQLLSGPATLAGNTVTLTGGTGTVRVRALQAGDGIYAAAAAVTRTFRVLSPTVNVALTNLTQVYDGDPKMVGLAELPEGATIEVTYAGGTTPPTAAGRYRVRAVVNGSIVRNGNLTIEKAPLKVVADDQRKFIGAPLPPLTFRYDGLRGGDTAESAVATHPAISTRARQNSQQGVYPITFRGGVSANYRLVFVNGSMVVEGFGGTYETLLLDSESGIPLGIVNIRVGRAHSFSGTLRTSSHLPATRLRGSLTVNEGTESASWMQDLGNLSGRANNLTFDLPYEGGFGATLTFDGGTQDERVAVGADGAAIYQAAPRSSVPYAGAHTIIFAPGTEVAPPPVMAAPSGAGFATGAIHQRTGVMRLAGELGDGRRITQSLFPDYEGRYRAFITPYRRLHSALAGSMLPVDIPAPPAELAGRRAVAAASDTGWFWGKAGLAADANYRDGFGPLRMVVTMDPWLRPATRPVAVTLEQRLGLGTGEAFGVAHQVFAHEQFDLLPTAAVIGARNRLTPLAPVPSLSSWAITFNANNGTYNGSAQMVDPDGTRRVTIKGALRQPRAGDPDTRIGEGYLLLGPPNTARRDPSESFGHRFNKFGL